jgi:hypothetical protein
MSGLPREVAGSGWTVVIWRMPAYRRFLFAPGNHARKAMKVLGCGADNVILDLENQPMGDEPGGNS